MSVIFLLLITQLHEEGWVGRGKARKSYMGSWERSTSLKITYFGSKGTPLSFIA